MSATATAQPVSRPAGPPAPPRAAKSAIETAAKILDEAKRPVILAGRNRSRGSRTPIKSAGSAGFLSTPALG